MFRSRSLRLAVCAASMLLVRTVVWAQDSGMSFVYTNDDVAGPNTVSAFSVSAGALVAVSGSPFSTGGTGFGDSLYAAPRLVIAGKFLYASNAVSSNVSGFVINPATGGLTSVSGSPFATGGTGSAISIAATPNGAFLMAGYAGTNTITVFSVNPTTGALTPVSGSPFPAGSTVNGMKVTPDGKFLVATLPNSPPGKVGVFRIAASGALAPVAGSPFAATTPAGVEINCKSSLVFAGGASTSAASSMSSAWMRRAR